MSFFYLAIVQSLLFSLVHSQSCSSQTGVKLTFYGFPDGMSDITSFGCKGTTLLPPDQSGKAGGDGSFANPETFATAMTNTAFKECEIVYIPYFQKYFQYMDHCQAAIADIAAGLTHLDLWIGPQSDQGQLPCEQSFGVLNDQTVIRSPPSTLPVTSGALVDGGICYNTASGGRIFPNYDASSLCSGGSSSSGSGSGSPPPASSSTAPAPVATPATNPNPISNPPTISQPKKEEVKQVLNPAPASSSAPVQLPIVQNKIAQNAPPTQTPAPTTMMTMTSTSAPAPATSTTAAAAAAAPSSKINGSGKVSGPKMNWNSGMSYADQIGAEMANCASWNACLGDTCSSYADCAGEWVCVTGVCHDNMTG